MGTSLDVVDDADLDSIVEALDRPRDTLRDISVALAEESINLVREGFAGTHAPDGSGWAPRKSGAGKVLHGPTGALRTSWNRGSATATGFAVRSAVGYAAYHQSGTRHMPARKMVPDDGELPSAWESRYDEVTEEILDGLLG